MSPEQTLEATFRAGNFALARKMAVAMLQKNVRNKTALQVLAHVALLIGVSNEALSIATKAHEVDQDDPKTNLLLAEIHGARGKTEQALTYCERVLELHPGDFSALKIQAKLLERSGDWHEAVQILGPHAGITPRTSQFSLTLARCLMQAEKYDAAIELIDATLPDVEGDTPNAKQQQANLIKLRARIQDRAANYDQAWADVTAANTLLQTDYEPSKLSSEIDQLIDWFDAKRFDSMDRSEHSGSQHIFIVGMPRTGTTLIEQILDAHPEVIGLGEINSLDVASRMLPQNMQIKEPFPNILHYAEAKRFTKMAEEYEQSIEQAGFTQSNTYVNKSLRNPFLLGLIALLFPKAKVVFTSRDARDAAVSGYLAGLNHNLFPYLLNPDHIASAAADFQRLNAHWQSTLPLQWITVEYETLVAQQEKETRRLLEFCEIDWNAKCLKFWQSPRTVMTHSYDQVTRPLYDHAVGRYKNYEKYIGKLLEN